MSNPSIPARSLAALNDNELEILQMLASGHTAKSIANTLGRTETAINERLREARRKTGVGSSRELARLLDAQKIWDKNIGLADAGHSDEGSDVLPAWGFEWTKGRIAMLIAAPAALFGLAVLTTTINPADDAPRQAGAKMPGPSALAGRWSLDVARLPADERPVAVTIAFESVSDGRLHTLVTIETGDGALRKAESTAALDGVAVPVRGSMAEVDSVSLRQPDAKTLVMTLGKDGRRVSTRVYTVASDGKSMTETIVWAAQGMPQIVTTSFNRVS